MVLIYSLRVIFCRSPQTILIHTYNFNGTTHAPRIEIIDRAHAPAVYSHRASNRLWTCVEELLKRHTYSLESGLNSDPTLAQRELRLMGQSPMQTISPRLALLGFASLFYGLSAHGTARRTTVLSFSLCFRLNRALTAMIGIH